MIKRFFLIIALIFPFISHAADDSAQVYRFSPDGDALYHSGGKSPFLQAIVVFQTDEGYQVLLNGTTVCLGGPLKSHHFMNSKTAILAGPPNNDLRGFFSEHEESYQFHVLECVHSEKTEKGDPTLTVPVIVRNYADTLVSTGILQMILNIWNEKPGQDLHLCPIDKLSEDSEPFKVLRPYIKAFLEGNDLAELLKNQDIDHPLRQHFRLSHYPSQPTIQPRKKTVGGNIKHFLSSVF